MVQVGALTASPANLAKADLLPLSDTSSGYLTKATLDQVVKPVCGMITATGTTTNLGAIAGTWTKITSFDAVSGLGAGTTESHSSDQITINAPYICLVMYSVTANAAGGARQLGVRLAKDGTAIAGSYAHEATIGASGLANMANQVLVTLAATDVITVEIAIPAGTTTGNVIVNEANLTIIPIGPAS